MIFFRLKRNSAFSRDRFRFFISSFEKLVSCGLIQRKTYVNIFNKLDKIYFLQKCKIKCFGNGSCLYNSFTNYFIQYQNMLTSYLLKIQVHENILCLKNYSYIVVVMVVSCTNWNKYKSCNTIKMKPIS
jgi:hypothetical protein